jgi:hypothetical protein
MTTRTKAPRYRRVVILLVALCVAVGICSSSGAQGDDAKAKRRAELQAIARAYFDGLAQHDLSKFPYANNIILHAPLNPNGGADNPIIGRDKVLAFFAGVLPAIGTVQGRDTYVNEALTIVCAEAKVGVVTPVVNTGLCVAD